MIGCPCVVTRSLQVTKKKSKLEFKAVDGVIKTTNENGDKVSISHKCSDLDKMIPELLDVSGPILENVIFCHQEDRCDTILLSCIYTLYVYTHTRIYTYTVYIIM